MILMSYGIWGYFSPCTLYKESIFLTSCVYTYLHAKPIYLLLFHSLWIRSCHIFWFTQLRNMEVSIPILKMLLPQYNINVYCYYCMSSFSWYLVNYLFIDHSDFPGGSVVKNPPASTGDTGDSGRSLGQNIP